MSFIERGLGLAKRAVYFIFLLVGSAVIRLLGVTRVKNALLSIRFQGFHRVVGHQVVKLFTRLQRPVAAAEYASAVFKLKPNIWAAVLAVRYQLFVGDYEQARTIIEYGSKNFMPAPKKMHLFESLMDFETIVMIQTGRLRTCDIEGTVFGRNEIANFYYTTAWRYHTLLDGKNVLECAQGYCRAIGYEPEPTIYACEVLLRPYDHWSPIQDILSEVMRVSDERVASKDYGPFSRRKAHEIDLHRRMLSLRAMCCLQSGDMAGAERIFAGPDGEAPDLQFPRALYHSLRNEPELSARAASRGLRHCKVTKDNAQFIADVLHYVGRAWEEARNYVLAREFYKRAYQVGGVSFWLPEPVWRYISLLTAFGEWGRSVNMLRVGLKRMWESYRTLARVPIERRILQGRYIPKRGAAILGGNGVGDEILRFGILRALAPKTVAFSYAADRRLAGLFERAMPRLKVVSPSRVHGPFKVTEAQFWADREGLPPGVDRMRVTHDVLRAIRRHGETMLSEDLVVAFFEQGGRFRGSSAPVFEPLPDQTERMNAWLATLPPGTNVGVSWRSGQAGLIRDVSYTRVEEWREIFTIPNVNFVLLQYSNKMEDIDRELKQVEDLFGVRVHVMPGFDLRDDFEGMVALCRALDVVIAPGTTLRETAAAAGARTWTLSTTPYLPDQWRIDQDDKHTDVIFPSMIHFTALQYGGRAGALEEIANRLRVVAANDFKTQPDGQMSKEQFVRTQTPADGAEPAVPAGRERDPIFVARLSSQTVPAPAK